MSNYNSEHGQFTLPAGAYRQVKLAVLEAANKNIAGALTTAQRIYDKIMAQGKGKRNFDYHDAYTEAMEDVNICRRLIFKALFKKYQPGNASRGPVYGRPTAPKQNDFKALPYKTETVRATSWAGEITFNDAAKTITWTVAENNHAVEEARGSRVAQALFNALNRVKWTRTTGGFIEYVDEYMEGYDGHKASPQLRNRLGIGTKPTWEEEAMYARWKKEDAARASQRKRIAAKQPR